jgi:hypothetical protein
VRISISESPALVNAVSAPPARVSAASGTWTDFGLYFVASRRRLARLPRDDAAHLPGQ